MFDTLKRVCYDGGRLHNVFGSQFVGDAGNPPLIAAIALQLEALTVVFRASTDDTLADSIGILGAEPDERFVDLSNQPPWTSCLGLRIFWGWQLTNQQGYTDGVRLEFSDANQSSRRIVELVAIASRIQVFDAAQVEGT